MSFNRNKPTDIQETRKAINVGVGTIENGKNWLGHRTSCGNAKIDTLLLNRDGITKKEMLKHRRAVNEHLRHLRVEHGLTLELIGNKYRFGK